MSRIAANSVPIGVTIAALLLSAASAAAVTQPKPVAILPINLDDKVASIDGSIQDTLMHFFIDSGGVHTVLDAQAAKRLGLSVAGAYSASGTGKGSVQALLLSPFSITLGDARVVATAPLALDLSNVGEQRHEDGIIGFDLYKSYVVDADYERRMMTLYDPTTYRYDGRGAKIPLIVRPPRIFVKVTVAAPGVSAEEHVLRLDTGSSDDVDDDIVLRSAEPKKVITGGVGIGTRFQTYLGTVSELQLGPYTLRDLPSATGGVQLLGNGVLSRFHVVIDVAHSVMYLTPRS